jgi:hypothetical protein
MRALEIFHDDSDSYFYLSEDIVAQLNILYSTPDDELKHDTRVGWTITPYGLRKVLQDCVYTSDAVELMALIQSIKKPVNLCGISWITLDVIHLNTLDLKPKIRDRYNITANDASSKVILVHIS